MKLSAELILLICGIYWISAALIVNTKTFIAAVVAKVIPFFTGLAVLLCAADLYGWINIF